MQYSIPNYFFKQRLATKLFQIENYENQKSEIMERANYYNKLNDPYQISTDYIKIKDFTLDKKFKPYTNFCDTYEYFKYFSSDASLAFLFGDITHIPSSPKIVKSRPIKGNNINSIILNLDKLRHFIFLNDHEPFVHKKNQLIGRGGIYQKHRIKFYEQYFQHPLCNLGHVGKNENKHPEWTVAPLPISKHLNYKFILCLEGNDVASNLKWVMSSNSIAVMPRPKYETWFMEGQLKPNYHYIEIKDDYSDLETKLIYYSQNISESLAIIKNAHNYIERFNNTNIEDLISLLVVKKYLDLQLSR